MVSRNENRLPVGARGVLGGGLALVLVAPSVTFAQGPPCIPQQKLLPSGVGPEDHFGSSLAASGDTAIVGAREDTAPAPGNGFAIVFVRSGTAWVEQAKLTASNGASLDAFGCSVGLVGDTAVVGALLHDVTGLSSGAAYVFVRQGASWSEQAELVPSTGGQFHYFGDAVAISGDTVIVGAPIGDGAQPYSGVAFVFTRAGTSWIQQATLVASDGVVDDRFGTSVAISGDTAVVGATSDDEDRGSAYVFVRTGGNWSQQAKLLASDGHSSDYFGWTVAISDGTALVGALWHDHLGSDSGAAYVFRRAGSSWFQRAELLADDGDSFDRFGSSVALDGSRALVGAPFDEGGLDAFGSMYLFRRSGAEWSVEARLVADDGSAGDYLGTSAALSESAALGGAPGDDDAGNVSGSAYAFALHTGTRFCTCAVGSCGPSDPRAGCPNSTGAGALLEGRGTTVPDELDLLLSRAPAGEMAVFFQGDDEVALPFGDGLRCTGGNVVRLDVPPIVTGPSGDAFHGPCYGDPPISISTGVAPGETKRYQVWYRDPSGPCGSGFNLTNGLAVTW